MLDQPDQPHVVIIGGFLTEPLFYGPLRARLLDRGAARVTIAGLHLPDWLAMGLVGMGPVMLRGARAIREARRTSRSPLIVIGHSAGGIVARLAMSSASFDGRRVAVADDVGCLVTLGTPHRLLPSLPLWHHPGVQATEFLARSSPGAFFAPGTGYVTVGSTLVAHRPSRARSVRNLANRIIRPLVGEIPGVPGDGLVDNELSRLPGAHHVELSDVLHGTFGGPWYGDGDVVDRWWPAALTAWRSALAARTSGVSRPPDLATREARRR